MTPLLDLSAKPRGQWSTEDGLIHRLSRTVNGRIGPDVIVFKSDGSSSLFEYEKPEQKRVFPVFKMLPDTEIEGVCLSHSVASRGGSGVVSSHRPTAMSHQHSPYPFSSGTRPSWQCVNICASGLEPQSR